MLVLFEQQGEIGMKPHHNDYQMGLTFVNRKVNLIREYGTQKVVLSVCYIGTRKIIYG